ncbi:MAG: T9SS type A sorting domain-containing protein [Calditrichaeota bacterium]|nr:T9SS type A sorting domain-containing protein [Calditrichota bacterium]
MKHLKLALLIIISIASTAVGAGTQSGEPIVAVMQSPAGNVALTFNASAIIPEPITLSGQTHTIFALSEEGTTYERGMPLLPAVSRFVIVPPEAGLELVVRAETPRRRRDLAPPALCDDEKVMNKTGNRRGLYPPHIAEMSEPAVVRGVRIVKVTVYPVQYDFDADEYVFNGQIETEVLTNDSPPVNPALNPVRIIPGSQFDRYLREIASNPEAIRRDGGLEPPDKIGHYLVAAHESALLWHIPFIEWRRKAGYQMDIRLVTANMASSPEITRDSIRQNYIRCGADPFDQILLIGDRTTYDGRTAGPQYILTAFTGNSIWGSGGPHSDYLFGLMDGNDQWADVAVSRFPSGSQAVADLVVGRTLAYEAAPVINNPQWFRRGVVYSQHWGNSPTSAWHITIHTNVRWGEEVLQRLGFNDIVFYENYDHDQMGQVIGPVLRDQLNRGINMMIGRAEVYFWRDNFNGVNNNTVFPINICLSGHGEWSAYNYFRTGDGNNLKGPVAMTFGWGGPPTAPNSYMWAKMVNATLEKEFTFGWARALAITKIESAFPNVNVGRPLYDHVRTDIDMFGDPGIQPWIGVPRQVTAEYTRNISPHTKQIFISVRDNRDNQPVADAQVSIYAPGSIPTNSAAQYAAYRSMIQKTILSDHNGEARFVFTENQQFVANTPVYITVTGRDIRPFMASVNVTTPSSGLDVAGFEISEVEGNNDGAPNAGETCDLAIGARNTGNRDALPNVYAVFSSLSPYVEIVANDTVQFGNIGAGQSFDARSAVRLRFMSDCPDAASRPSLAPKVRVVLRSGNSTWESAITLPVRAPNFSLRQVVNGIEIGYNATNVSLEILNNGAAASPVLDAELFSRGLGITVVTSRSTFPTIGAGRFARQNGASFRLVGNRLAAPGSLTPMWLVLRGQNGFVDTVKFNLQTSRPRANAPQGPDGYGYICFDDTDTEWDIAPTYDWVEICPRDNNVDFQGTRIPFTGQSTFDIGECRVIPLPFRTRFYGEDFDTITVATNGFIAMGNQPRVTNFQNWPMDQAIAGGAGMLAPLWDDLRMDNNSGVYYYYNEDDNCFIVEWYRMKLATGGVPVLTFQVFLYDKDIWVTETGDPNIVFQYKEFTANNNIRGGDSEWVNNIPYASVGISSPDGKTGLSYVFNNTYPVTSAALQARRALLFSTSPRFRSGLLYGRVTDAATGQPLQGVNVYTQHGFSANTDAQGRWRIQDALAEITFTITARLAGYNDSTRTNLILREDDSLEINFALLHPEFTLNVQQVRSELEIDERRNMRFNLRNNGNGPLSYRIEKRLIGDANAAPWDLRRAYNVGQERNTDRLEGVVFIDNLFYISGAAAQPPHRIYVYDRDGQFIRSFDQPGASQYGLRDLEWDGELIWGSGDRRVYGFTPDGDVVSNWDGPYNPNMAITYDSERNVLWISSTTQNLVAYDRQGNRLGATLNRLGLRIQGLAYYPEDSDGYKIYITNCPGNNTINVHKMHPVSGDTMMVTHLNPANSTDVNAAYITNQFDVYSWVLLTIANVPRVNNLDRVEVYQVDARKDWFELDSYNGILNAGAVQDFTLTLNARELPAVEFRGELLFSHNAAGGEQILPVNLRVLPSAGERDTRRFDLLTGWNWVSLNVAPRDTNIVLLMQPLVEQGALGLLKDGHGRFYRPGVNFNNIPYWNCADGYEMFITNPLQWEISGLIIAGDRPITLQEGWNFAAYYPRRTVMPEQALAGIQEQLLIAKDIQGRFYLPEFGFSNMEPMREKNAYRYKVSADVDLVYHVDGDQNAAVGKPACKPLHYTAKLSGAGNASLLLLGEKDLTGWEAGVYTVNGELLGAGVFDADGHCGIAVWNDDDDDDDDDDDRENKDELVVKLWNGAVEITPNIKVAAGRMIWQNDGVIVAEVNMAAVPFEFGIHQAYPNPFNSAVRLQFGVMEAGGDVRLTIYDLSGREVVRLVDGAVNTGLHTALWRADGAAAGMFIARLTQGGRNTAIKLMLMK